MTLSFHLCCLLALFRVGNRRGCCILRSIDVHCRITLWRSVYVVATENAIHDTTFFRAVDNFGIVVQFDQGVSTKVWRIIESTTDVCCYFRRALAAAIGIMIDGATKDVHFRPDGSG